jgi:hypothetical protein
MNEIKVEHKTEFDSNVFINGEYFPDVEYISGSIFSCERLSDFITFSKFSFKELFENEVMWIIYKHSDLKKNQSSYFSYSINPQYQQDVDYFESLEEIDWKRDPNFIKKGNYISANLEFNYGEWKKLYSIKEFQLFIYKLILKEDFLTTNSNIYWSTQEPNDRLKSLTVELINLEETDPPYFLLNKFIELLDKILNKGITEMDNKHSIDIYSTYFIFPEEFKISCKQYLIYFSQFLLDLGISVNTEIKDTAAGTFFSVIPKDKNEAIENIKALLSEYMDAPSIIEEDNLILTNIPDNFALSQFQANLFHLRSQLAFANTQIELKQAIIEAKDATINSLKLTTYQFSEIIESQKPKDEESIIKGVVSVTKFEKAGFKINFAEIVRKLKRKF